MQTMSAMTEVIQLILPDGSVREVPSGTTPLEVAASIGPRLAKDAVGAELDGRRSTCASRSAGAALSASSPSRPRGRRVHPPQRRARARRRGQAPVARGRDRRRPRRTTPRSSSTTSASRAPSRPRTWRRSRRRCARSSPRARLRAHRGLPRGGRADLPRDRRDPQGRAPQGHPRGRDDHPLPPRPLHRPLPRAARPATCARSARSSCSRPPARYWRGDEANERLQRIYGTAFAAEKELDAHLERLEQARARDHRRLGQELDLFSFNPLAPAMPFLHPKGAASTTR